MLGVPWLAVIVVVVVAIAGYTMRSLRWAPRPLRDRLQPAGRRTRRHPGRPAGVHRFLVSGALAGFAGALFLALHAQIDVTGGAGYELTVVAAVVVGGVAIFGGSGTVARRGPGRVAAEHDQPGARRPQVSAFWNDAIAGALLLGAIAFDRWLSLRVTRSLESAQGAHRDV